MITDWQANAAATLIGSMPHRDRQGVIDLILRETPDIPVWPQLPANAGEQMMVQYLEGLPSLRSEQGRMFIDTGRADFEQELYAFYEEYLEVESGSKELNDSRFQFGPQTGKTFFQFLDTVHRRGPALKAVKGQVVGPFTLLSGLTDENRRALLYSDRLLDVVVKHLAMKACWQIARLQAFGCPVIIFLDEPALAGYGSSAYISVSEQLVQGLIEEVVSAIHQAGALAGIHVCANTDWLLILSSPIDIVNFDAYSYFDRFALYKDAFCSFVQSGRVIAWGMVPTTDLEAIEKETGQTLADRWFEQIQGLQAPGCPVANILSQSLFTPSCGCGSLPEAVAERVVSLTRSLSEILQRRLTELKD